MKKKSLQQRITFLSVGLAALSLLFLTITFAGRDEELFIQQNNTLRHRLSEALAISITNALLYEELGLIEEGGLIENYIEEWMHTPDLHVRSIHVFNPAGIVVASSNLREVGSPCDRSDLLPEGESSTVSHQITSPGNEPLLEVVTPLNISTRSWGTLRILYSLQPMKDELKGIRIASAGIALLLFIFIALILTLYVRTAIAPLRELRDFVAAIPKQSWLRAPVRSHDEIGEVAQSFNDMLDELESVREHERETQERFHHSERVAMIGKLAAGVAHEVRNPIAGIGNLVENLDRYRHNDSKFHEYTEAITQGLQRIERIVANLVSLGHQAPSDPQPIDPVATIQEILDLSAYNLNKNSVRIEWDIVPGIPPVLADRDQFRQVILNLVLNAVHAMEKSGGLLTIGISRQENRLEISFTDTGIGISREHMTHIFDPFFTTLPVGEGSGLGLAVSKSIMEQHGGSIEVESEVGKGTRFLLHFPLVSAMGEGDAG